MYLRQAAGRDVGVDALIGAGLGFGLTPVHDIYRHPIRQLTSAVGDLLKYGHHKLRIRFLVGKPTGRITWWLLSTTCWQL
jgi:hypothetical protein